jgi:hypothetical protein
VTETQPTHLFSVLRSPQHETWATRDARNFLRPFQFRAGSGLGPFCLSSSIAPGDPTLDDASGHAVQTESTC